MSSDVLSRGSPPLPTPAGLLSCIASSDYWPRCEPSTWGGDCNFFACHCDHCYGESNCKGTDDSPRSPLAWERIKVKWTCWQDGSQFNGPGFYDSSCPELRPYLECPASSAGGGGGAVVPPNCADKELVLSEPINATVARLSGVFCSPGSDGDVGLSFAGQMLDSLDADNNGLVSCTEWGIAKERTTFVELVSSGAGGYFGPKAIDPPACKMSPSGKERLAKYNTYLAGLTLATAARNTTAWVSETARGAALAVEGHLVGNAAVGAATTAKEGLLDAWNRTISG